MIEFKNFTFQYKEGTVPALADINMKINKGDFVGIIGNSGAGKSTLTYTINGVIPHYYTGDFYGEVTVNGYDTVETKPESISTVVGSVFQDIDAQMVASVVEDEILFGLENFGVPKAEIPNRLNEALEKVGIADLRQRAINSLSGGQRQKVAIAAIIALRPEIIVLDEPTGELDPGSSRQLFMMLKKLNEEYGMTIVIVEQKIMLLCEFCQKLAVIEKGRLALYGEVREVLEHSREMEKMGINVPRVVSLSSILSEKGVYKGKPPISIEEAKKMVLESLT